MCAVAYPSRHPRNATLDAPLGVAHTPPISERAGGILESERLARHWWALVDERAFDQLCELLHEDVVVVSKMQPGLVLEGRGQVVRFVQETLAEHLYEATTSAYHPIDDVRVVVEGRIRWIDEERVIRDDPVTWAMEFRDGLLVRFLPARTQVEAETILGAPAP